MVTTSYLTETATGCYNNSPRS